MATGELTHARRRALATCLSHAHHVRALLCTDRARVLWLVRRSSPQLATQPVTSFTSYLMHFILGSAGDEQRAASGGFLREALP